MARRANVPLGFSTRSLRVPAGVSVLVLPSGTYSFSDDALRAIAREAMNRKVGARGLRMILEELMLDLMYHLPAQKRVKEFEVSAEMVEKRDISLAVMEKQAS